MSTLAVVLAASAGPDGTAAQSPGTAVIKGRAVFVGDPPPMRQLPPMGGDPACARQHPKPPADQATIVYPGTKAIPYVFVHVKTGVKGKFDPPGEPAVLDQRGCVYHPHVFGMMAGQPLHIKSSDATSHNIHALPRKNEPFNLAQPNIGTLKREGKDTFNKPESPIKIKCDVHGWMSAWVHVMEHPFFDTTKDHYEFPSKVDGRESPENVARWGTFEIKPLPAGDYELEAWHETFGKVSQKVSIKDGETKDITFEFKKPEKKKG